MDNQSMMYIFCNWDLVKKTTKSKQLQPKINGGTITVSHQAMV